MAKWWPWRQHSELEREIEKPPAVPCGGEEGEITFEVWISGYRNNSHGQTCCVCGGLLPAIEVGGGFFSPRFPGIGQVELQFNRECFHRRVSAFGQGDLWGGYVCSEACAIGVREWLKTASPWDICPDHHRAKGLEGASPPKPLLAPDALDGIARNADRIRHG